jgi:plastocyanin
MKPWSRAFVVILAVTHMALTGCSRERSGDVRDGTASDDAVEIVLEDDAFVPDVLRLDAGEEIDVEVRNDGSYGHNFTIDALDLSTGTVDPGEVMTTTFVVPNGTTEFRCTFHPGMDGEIVTG